MSCTSIRGSGSVSDAVTGVRSRKCVFWGVAQLDPQMDLCTLDFRGCSRSFVSLLHTVACPSRCILTCPILPSGGADLVRTQLHVRAVDKYVYLGVAAQDPQMKTCINVH